MKCEAIRVSEKVLGQKVPDGRRESGRLALLLFAASKMCAIIVSGEKKKVENNR